jgi:hypothetical protein
MNTNGNSRLHLRRPFVAALVVGIIVALPGPQRGSAATININFDGFPAANPEPANFLSAFGISSVVNTSNLGTSPGAGGPSVVLLSNVSMPGSTQGAGKALAFQQASTSNDVNQHDILTLTFSTPLTAFSLMRVGTINGGSTDTWSARFYDGSNNLLGSFGESSPLINAAATTFSTTATAGDPIATMQLDSFYTNFATYRNIPVGNFVLTTVPEPSVLSAAAAGVMGSIGFARCRKRPA